MPDTYETVTPSPDARKSTVDYVPADEQPQQIGRYRIERVLGKGGFGLVYLAHDDQLKRAVAIKVAHARLLSRPEDAEAYLTEARTVASLDHPNIVPVHDVGSTEEFPCFVVSKYIDGTDLFTRLRQSRLSVQETVELIATVAEALHYAHKQEIVHRDIKPGNILLDKTGKPFVADFGLALREQDVGHGPIYAGTPAYMSPEQARGEGHRVDGRSDIFSLGVVFYELLTGKRPFKGESTAELLVQIASVDVKPPRQIDDTISKELERIGLKALSKRASERYSTAKDMADDLRHFLASASEEEKSVLSVKSEDAVAISTPPPAPMPTPISDQTIIKIVPKGLRSFDAHDADFFLELLPGPRDRDGLPDSIRFWKTRIEEMDADNTFSVGLIYGPSGCGKSSLVKAGLLPRLSDAVVAVYLEATAEETEARLLNGLRKRCPALPGNLGLKERLAAMRRGQGIPAGKKVLIVLDQFEQWLHAKKDEEDTELVQALRQCDGGRVQCIVMVRDDFWMAATRFMRELEVRLIEAQNSAAVDLFPIRHAEKVLAAFGRAFGALPEAERSTLAPSLQALVNRLELLSDQYRELREGVQKVIQVADVDPEMALTRSRKVLEYVIRDVYERRVNEPPGTRPLENLLQRIVKDGHFPDRLDAYANTIRKLGNVGTHTFGEKVTVADVHQSLTQLVPILEWYFEIERPEALAGKQSAPAQLLKVVGGSSREHQEFLEQAVTGLAQEGKVISVRLALFAEMMKGKSWTPAILKEVGGTEGVGVTFLEETFSAATAPPEHRYHQKAARRLLKALLPESGTDIKGHMRSRAELLEASGYASRPKDFDDLIHILDSEIRLITPTDPEGKDGDSSAQAQVGAKFYQLTHDYLVPSLRDWLTRKQKETRRGRAELLLADRAAVWNTRPEDRQLPSLLQWTQIRWWTQKKNWTPPQRKMMRKATRYHAVRAAVVGVALAVATFTGLVIRDRAEDRQNATHAAGLVQAVVNADTAQVPDIIGKMVEYRPWADPLLRAENEKWAVNSRQKLHASLALLRVDPTQVDYLYGRLLDAEPHEVPVIRDALTPHKDALLDKLWTVVERPDKGKESQRLRAAAALAKYDPNSERWTKAGIPLVKELVRENAVFLGQWTEAFRFVKGHFLAPLSDIFRDHQPERLAERTLATNLLADYAADNPQVLADLLIDADEKQFAAIYPKFKEHGDRGLSVLTGEIDKRAAVAVVKDEMIFETKGLIAEDDAKVKTQNGFLLAKRFEVRLQAGKTYRLTMDSNDIDSFLVLQDKTGKELAFDDDSGGGVNSLLMYKPSSDDTYTVFAASLPNPMAKDTGSFVLKVMETVGGTGTEDDAKERLAKRQANGAVALLRMKQEEKVWPLLKHSPDPRVRSYLIHRLGPLGAEATAIVKRLDQEPDITIRRALILSLGEYSERDWSADDRGVLTKKLQKIYSTAADPGLHAASEWLLRHWKHEAWLKQTDDGWAKDAEQREKRLDEIKQTVAKEKEKMPPQWYVNGQGQTMVVVPGPVEFVMGSPSTEADRGNNENQHKKRIGRTFAVASKSVTMEQYQKFSKSYNVGFTKYHRMANLPVVGTSWYQAAAYCNWLSEKEGIDEKEWCYEIKGQETKLRENYLSLSGYRLPTEAEMEYATRAGAVTSRYFGETEELVPKYAWYTKNSKEQTWPVGSLKPNDLGLFDVQGNVYTWCQESYKSYPTRKGEEAVEDREDGLVISPTQSRVLRGGSFLNLASTLRSANRLYNVPTFRNTTVGFRVARTLPLDGFTALQPPPEGGGK